MITKIQNWGNSQGLRLAKQVLEDAHISVGEEVADTARRRTNRRIEGRTIWTHPCRYIRC
jgi:antitoxin component of MazEF toxin-antitoxin module